MPNVLLHAEQDSLFFRDAKNFGSNPTWEGEKGKRDHSNVRYAYRLHLT